MKTVSRKKMTIDNNTKQYMKEVRLLHIVVLVIISIAFLIFANTIVSNNRNNLKEVVLVEVQESMQENINNIIIHIESLRKSVEENAMVHIIDLENQMKTGGVKNVEGILAYLQVCEQNQLGQAIEAVYTAKTGEVYYINKYERTVISISEANPGIYNSAPVADKFVIEGQEIILFVQQSEIDLLVKEEMRNYLHSEQYEGGQYVWVNEVLNFSGGENYAVRCIHPNLIETEGEYLSTFIQDVKGNYPYQTELDGIKENGYVFHSYYFKNKENDEITEKFSYAQYYEPFNWIIATGETIEEVYAYSEEVSERSFQQIFLLMVIFVALFVVTSGLMVRILETQAQAFRNVLLKQAEMYENIYTTMSVGLLRIRVTEEESRLIQINPKGLELLGVETQQECLKKVHGHVIETMETADAERLQRALKMLSEQWESVVVECWVTWKDGSRHLLRIRDTLVDFEEEAKIIQRMCQDITEERARQQKALMEAEEKATLDPMTQIKNKKAIEGIIRTKIVEAAKQNLPIAIGFVDIDNFRDYNTKYGHMQGDEVIKYVASTIKENIPGIVGRNGGDEFAFVVFNASYTQIETAMQVVHKKLNEGIIVKETGEKIPTPCSIGVIIEKSKTLDYDYVMEQSDAAMYEAKARGKNTYYILEHDVS